MDPAWVTALIALVSAVLGLVVWSVRWLWRVLSRTTRFLDDYFGEPAHDGLPARPGVMARLHAVEAQLGGIAAELHPNSGHSLRDEVQQMATDMTTVKAGLGRLDDRVRQMGAG